MTEEQSRKLLMQVRELDGYVPAGEQSVKLGYSEEAGDEGVAITATRDGFLRLGTELLKAATISPCEAQEDGSYRIEADLSKLLHPQSDYGLDELTLVDRIEDAAGNSEAGAEAEGAKASDLIGISIVLFLLIAVIVGIGTIISWLISLLKFITGF